MTSRARPQLAQGAAPDGGGDEAGLADREAYYGDPKHVKVPADASSPRCTRRPARADPRGPRLARAAAAGDPYGLAAVRNGAARTPSGPRGSAPPSTPPTCAWWTSRATASRPRPAIPAWTPRWCRAWLRGLAPRLAGLARAGHPSEVAPGKRPRLTPAPAMAFKAGKLFMPFGTPGGDVQQQAMLQVFLNVTAYGMRCSGPSRRPAGHALLPGFLLAASRRAGRARDRAPHARRDPRGPGRARPPGE